MTGKRSLSIAVVSMWLLAAGSALAQNDPSELGLQHYRKGRALIAQKAYTEALQELEASHRLLPSPNTLLLIAHAQRELGQRTKAARSYALVVEQAEERVKAGENRFAAAANDAKRWLNELGKQLGRVSITIPDAGHANVTVTVNDEPVELERDVDAVRARNIWVQPGLVVVETVIDGHRRQTRVEAPANGTASVVVDMPSTSAPVAEPVVAPQDEPASAPVVPETPSKLRVPVGSWVGLGVGAAGMVAFGVFGSMAKSNSEELDACSPRCPESMRPTADDGKRNQTIANIGLAVGGVGLATAVGFFVLGRGQDQKPTLEAAVSPGFVQLRQRF